MREEFYAVLKLVTGEEILTQIKKLDKEYEGYFILHSPIQVDEVCIPGIISGLKVDRWMKISNQETFLLHKDKILTMLELDSPVKLFYQKSLDKLKIEENSHRNNVSEDSDYLSSIEEIRNTLEELYNKY
jgi:Sm_like domain